MLRNIKTLDSFRNLSFRLYFFGMAGQWAAQSMQMVVQSLLIYRLTGSAAILGLMALVNAIPQVVLSLFAGVLADRFPKKNLIQISQLVMALCSAGIGIALATGYMSIEHNGSWWVLMVTAAFQGVLNALILPARQAIIPELVNKEQVMNAISLNNSGMNIFQFISPAIGGFLIDAFNRGNGGPAGTGGFQAVYFIMSGLCLLAIIFTNFLPNTGIRASGKRNMFSDVVEGLQYIKRHTIILLVTIFTMICIIVGTPPSSMSSIFADSILKVGATGLGILQSVSGAGALLASLILASLPNKKRGLIMLAGGLCMGLALLVFSFSRIWWLSLVMMAFAGIGKIFHVTPGISLLMSHTDKEYQGRVQSVQMLSVGLGSLATFSIGILTQSIGVQWAMGGFAMFLVLISVLSLSFVPKLRKSD